MRLFKRNKNCEHMISVQDDTVKKVVEFNKKTGEYEEFWQDENYNKWSCEKYSKEEAIKLSRTLFNCRNCINCEQCSNCEDCYKCFQCYSCTSCEKCQYCSLCEYCIKGDRVQRVSNFNDSCKYYHSFESDNVYFKNKLGQILVTTSCYRSFLGGISFNTFFLTDFLQTKNDLYNKAKENNDADKVEEIDKIMRECVGVKELFTINNCYDKSHNCNDKETESTPINNANATTKYSVKDNKSKDKDDDIFKTHYTIRRVDESGRVVIPKAMREHHNISEGDTMMIAYNSDNDNFVLKKYKSEEE